MRNLRALILFFALFPLFAQAQTGRVIVNPDQNYEPTLNKTASVSFDTLTNNLVLNPKNAAKVIFPNTLTLPAFVRAALSVGAGPITYNSATGQFGFTPLAVSDITGLSTSLSGKVDLSGSYANPSWLVSLPFSKLTTTPTTLSGYGITNGVSSINSIAPVSGNVTLNTGNIAESGNEYFTSARARLAFSGTGAISYNNLTGVVSLNSSAQLPGTPTVQTQPGNSDDSPAIATTAWVRAQNYGVAGAGSNNGSNVGTAGIGIFKDINVATFRFKKVNTTSNLLTITDDTANDEVDLTINQGNLSIAGSQVTGTIATAQTPAYTGDVTKPTSSGVTTLATVNTNVGSFGAAASVPTFTVNGKGLITAAGNTAISLPAGQITGTLSTAQTPAYTGDITKASGSGATTLATVNSNVGAFGSGTTVPTVTVNGKGLVTAVTTTAITPADIGAEPTITDGTSSQVILGNKTLGTLNGALVGLGNLPNVDATNAANIGTGTLPAGRLPAFSGDVATTAGSSVATITSSAVTNTKLALVPANTLKGSNNNASANPTDLTTAQVKTMLAYTNADIGSEPTANKATNFTSPDNIKFPTTLATSTALNLKPENVSLSTLRASSGATYNAVVLTDINRGGGTYVYDAASVEADNGGTILKTTDNRVYKLQYPGSSVDAKVFGIVYGTGQSAGVRTANNAAFQTALNSGVGIEVSGMFEKTGTTTITNKSVYLFGTGYYSGFRQMDDANGLVINQTVATTETNISDITMEATGAFAVGAGFTHNGYSTINNTSVAFYQKPSLNLTRVTIRADDFYVNNVISKTWKKGIVISNPNRVNISDCTVSGSWTETNMNGSIGVEITSNRLSVENVFRNVIVQNMETGFKANKATVIPALEGTQFNACKAITCLDGIVLLGSSAYRSPGFWINDGHFACHRKNIYVEDVNQGWITDNLIYNFGNSITGASNFATFGHLNRVSDTHVTGNVAIYQENGATVNTTNGFLLDGGTTIPEYAVANIFSHNYIVLKSGTATAAIHLRDFAQNNTVSYTTRVGGTFTVVRNLPYGNSVTNSSPTDAEDAEITAIIAGFGTDKGASLTRFNPADALQGYILDISYLQSEQVSIPGSLIEAGSFIKSVTMRAGQVATLNFTGTVRVNHSAGLYLRDARNEEFYAGENLTLYGGAVVSERARRINRVGYTYVDVSAGTAQTINASRGQVYSLYNAGGSTLAITVDVSKLKFGDTFTMKRYPDAANTGAITVQGSSGSIEVPGGTLVASTSIPTTSGARWYEFQFTSGGHLELIGSSAAGGAATTDASLLTTGTLDAARFPARTGDVTSPAGSAVNTLATVNSNVGTFGSSTLIPVVTVNAKGLITAVSTVAASGGGGSASFATLTPSATTGTGTVAMAANALNWSAYSTTGNHTANITQTAATVGSLRLRVTLGGVHTFALQYGGVTGNVKWPGGTTPTFPTTSGNVFVIEGIGDGSIFEVTNYYSR